jgi:hypothetical protein
MKHLLEQVHSSEPVPIMAPLPRPLEIVPSRGPANASPSRSAIPPRPAS